jgi:hypothetical protein
VWQIADQTNSGFRTRQVGLPGCFSPGPELPLARLLRTLIPVARWLRSLRTPPRLLTGQ